SSIRLLSMNKLPAERRCAVVHALVEGNSVRATARITGTAKGTVLRLLAEIGDACTRFHDRTVRNVPAKRVQCDEIWSFTYAKQRNLAPALQGRAGFGDTWTWVGLDADSKLAIAWRVGDRGPSTAVPFVKDLA